MNSNIHKLYTKVNINKKLLVFDNITYLNQINAIISTIAFEIQKNFEKRSNKRLFALKTKLYIPFFANFIFVPDSVVVTKLNFSIYLKQK